MLTRVLQLILWMLLLGAAPCFASVQTKGAAMPARKAAIRAGAISFETSIKPLLTQFCFECHNSDKKKGDLALDVYATLEQARKDRDVWEKALHHLQAGEMPPVKKPQPSPDQRDLLIHWIRDEALACDCSKPDPGRVTLRRLNRVEYNNTIRDLVGIDFKPAANFPADDTGYGFDNIGDVLSLPPILLEKYLVAAEQIMEQAIVIPQEHGISTHRFEAERMTCTASQYQTNRSTIEISTEGEVYSSWVFPGDGDYAFTIRAGSHQPGKQPVRAGLLIDGRLLAQFEIDSRAAEPKPYEKTVHITGGTRRISVAFLNPFTGLEETVLRSRSRLILDSIEVRGPVRTESEPTEFQKKLFTKNGLPADKKLRARSMIADFAFRAYRRPLPEGEIGRLMQLFEMADGQGESFERSIQIVLEAVLVSPHFLFRGELHPAPDNPKIIVPINEFELASRLSYFLWSSMPDEELFRLARQKRLRQQLPAQLRRMMSDRKFDAFVENFAGQWLQLRNLDFIQPDRRLFPRFDDSLRQSMRRETELFFGAIVRENRSIFELLDAPFTFVNERLARHYGIDGIQGDEFQRVFLPSSARGGILTQGSILTVTSNPTRTSPVKRGKWVLENILGMPPPPPPPNAGELNEFRKEKEPVSLRQRLEAHRRNPSCASCHSRMDPIGFGLENFDPVGAWRDKEGNLPIDSSGELFGKTPFNGPSELRKLLLSEREPFAKCLTEKLLTYALGRGVETYDQCAMDEILKKTARNGYRFQDLIREIVESVPFQKRRGEEAR